MLIPYHTNRLSFGVPLEDVFAPEEIHPALQSLLYEGYNNIVRSPYSVEEILSDSRLQGTLHERLNLKDRIIICKTFEGIKVLPGIPLWVLRHFLGLLPTPLIPQYGDGKQFAWLDISTDCKLALSDYATRGRFNPKLLQKVTGELKKLPQCNMVMVTALFDFLRMLAVLPRGEPKINKSAIFAVVKYFTQSVFLRPFRPGWVTKKDKQYYPLQLYLILKWPEIRQICVKSDRKLFPLPIEEVYPGYHHSFAPGYPLYLSKCFRNNATQTSFPLQYNPDENDILIRVVPPSYHDFNFLRDTACQTDNCNNHPGAIPKSKVAEYKIPYQQRRDDSFLKRDYSCTYSNNNETKNNNVEAKYREFATETDDSLLLPDKQENIEDDKFNSNLDLHYSNSIKYGWNLMENGDISYTNINANPEFIENDNYISDGYSNCNLICDTENIGQSYNDCNDKEEKHSLNEVLKGKISQMGWTYTPSSENKVDMSEDMTPTNPTVSNHSKQDDYRLCNDVRRFLNEELKEKLSSLKIKEIYDEEIGNNYECDEAINLVASTSKLHLPEKCEESKQSMKNVGKKKSKLDFLKIFKTKNGKPKTSISCEQMQCEVKYEKMGSTNSLV